MLGELYQYAIDHNLAARPGFKPKKPKAYVLIARDGSFIGIDLVDKAAEPVMAPDVGSASQGFEMCNPLIEKAFIPLLFSTEKGTEKQEKQMKTAQAKHPTFIKMLTDGAMVEPAFGIAADALENEDFRAAANQALTVAKIKPADPIGFKVDGMPLEASRLYSDWWGAYRKTISKKEKKKASNTDPICFITGESAPAMMTVTPVSGLNMVGGHTKGDAFLCYDKQAYRSFGLKKSMNAPVSEEAMVAVNAALTKLIADAGVIGGAKLVHWYSKEADNVIDPMEPIFQFDYFDDSAEDNSEDNNQDETNESKVKQSLERSAMQKSELLCRSIATGELPELGGAKYYIMPLAAVNGRMMVRGWQEGNFKELCDSLNAWFNDMRLISPNGKGITKNRPLLWFMFALLKPGDTKISFGDLKKRVIGSWDSGSWKGGELNHLSSRILSAILQNAPLPDEIPKRSMHLIYSTMLTVGDEQNVDNQSRIFKIVSETMAYQWLKIWLLREQRAKGASVFMGEKLNPEYPGIAYQCGRLMAVYAEVQRKALGDDIGAGVIQRYFASASRAPGLVLRQLSLLYPHHLAKIEKKSTVRYLENLVLEINSKIDELPPIMLSVEQQTEFVLGYYHQKASIWQKSDTTAVNTETDDN